MTDLQTEVVEEPATSQKNISQKDVTKSTAEAKDWTIKALPANVVETTREAARINGMKINAWVGNALLEAAASKRLHNKAPDLTSERMAQFENGILEKLSELQRKNEELTLTINSMSSILIRLSELKKA